MTALESWLSSSPGSAAPLWTLEGLRGADPVLGFALVMLAAVALAELLHRKLRAPRMLGHMITGALASPLALRLLDRTDLDPWKPVIDLAIGVLVFELGSRIRPRWLIDNPWLAFTCVLEGVLAGLFVAVTLVWLGAPVPSAWLAGAVAMSTSPVITLVLVHEVRSRGQVTERLLIITAINTALAMLALKAWNVVAAAGSVNIGNELLPVITDAVVVIGGSFLLGVFAGWLLAKLNQPLRDAAAAPVLQIALVILAAMVAAQWKLSPLLALLVAGMTARSKMGHMLTVEPQLGSAGAVLTVLLFIALGMLFTLDGMATLWPWVVAILLARLVGKGVAVALLARLSALSWRQAAALTLTLQPMSSLAVLLAGNTFGWASQMPGVTGGVLQALLIATTLSHLVGPVLTKWSLQSLADECPQPAAKGA
ncbi:cation:proton antiporter [Rhizobacter sp. J219]|jgi:Kef-type K+ transport system membrane component KefB|uniref:cation:proton antiporter n=1 Tax=Rhizobacter sp. J219 TaxID=2898430 RepID=UPI002150FC00|nr:cation:proton antiporter [Rhizobacter sp. J219]MCR5885351.1 cation:proton antiporter [Rhizobacter sp. J219]